MIAANWKMNKNVAESLELVNDLKERLKGVDREILVCPPFTSLGFVADALKGSNIKVGAQDMHFEDDGAFTGEVSARMLADLNAEYVILGHSERRALFNESNEIVNKKFHKAIENGLKPILCVGESLEEREQGKEQEVVASQFRESLKDVKDVDFVIAYEPVWAIGTGKTATPEQAQEMHAFLKELVKEKFGKDVKILYGGSVNPENVDSLMKQKDIDGCLVGGASLDADSFSRIVNYEV